MKAAKVLVILQLCVVFTMLVRSAGYPFLGELYEKKVQLHVYEGLFRDRENWEGLTADRREIILEKHRLLRESSETGFGSRLKRSINIIIFEMPLFEKVWIWSAIVISILFLLQVEGVFQAVWILPLLTICYAVDNRMNGAENDLSEAKLFPSESYLYATYIQQPEASKILEQREQLLGGWEKYLVAEWAKEEISSDKELFEKQVKKGKFRFDLERIGYFHEESPFGKKEPFFFLVLYLIWNVYFCYVLYGRYGLYGQYGLHGQNV